MSTEDPEFTASSGNRNATDFEMWIRMATDNKINAKNSWNFELIDYFYDLSLLREGTSINFQKASATLDGCVKIYSSRVDSAATETGKLLSGLSSSNGSSRNNDEEQDFESLRDVEGVENDQVGPVSATKKKQPLQLATLVNSFNEIKAKKIELEMTSDPVFKKTLTLFDEGGAKSLLLNMLNIDSSGLVVFGTSKDSKEAKSDLDGQIEGSIDLDDTLDDRIETLGDFVFGNDNFENLHVCPSMSAIQDLVEKDDDNIENIFSFLDKDKANNDYIDIYSDDEQNSECDFFDDNEARIGENSMNLTLQRLFDETFQKDVAEKGESIEVTNVPDYDLLAYFDRSIKRNWHETKRHWKVSNLIKKYNTSNKREISIASNKKEMTVIDFFGEDENEDELFSEPVASISLPKTHRVDSSEHCLINDVDFTIKRLIRLFNKPIVLKTFRKKKKTPFAVVKEEDENILANEHYWSQKYKADEEFERSRRLDEIFREDLDELHQSYHQSFFQDDEKDYDIDPMGEGNFDDLIDSKDTQISKPSMRPTYINFARVAKKVDIKLLKTNLWNGLNTLFHSLSIDTDPSNILSEDTPIKESEYATNSFSVADNLSIATHATTENSDNSIKFSDLVGKLDSAYGKEERMNISTSFCFICLLHLANENGFTIDNNDKNDDLLIKNIINI